MALSAEQERYTENVFQIVLTLPKGREMVQGVKAPVGGLGGGGGGGGGRGPSLGSRGGAPFGGFLCRSSRYNKVQFHCCSIGRERAHVLPMSANSSFRVERRKRGNAQRASSSSYEAEGDRKLLSAGVRESYRARERRPEAVGRGLSPCEITFSRDHLRPSAANFTRVRMTAFVSRCVYYFIR